MNTNLYYSLQEIASWSLGDSEVTIPALQRGLVWKPKQVEFLWDSILRGFPIGSFLLSDITDSENKGKYYLMDGQQRYNAISIGFNTVPNPRAVLWIDLDPVSIKDSTRRFWIKATTIPHPWGFKNDEESSRLNTAEKRDALRQFNLEGNIYNKEFSLNSTWPVEANCPIPLWCLLQAADADTPDSFLEKAVQTFKSSEFEYRHLLSLSERTKSYVKDVLYPAIIGLKDYYIHCNHLSKEVMELETDVESGEQTTLEVLFTRLNTGGTAISREDLYYSAIKAYWPSIKEINDTIAEKYMNPSKLAMLAFRLALTSDTDKNLRNELSIRQIRSLANSTKYESERKSIEQVYKYLGEILEKIDTWLGVNDQDEMRTPAILRTIIARNSSEIYLLLMYLAYKDIQSGIDLCSQDIKALAFYLHWFNANDEKRRCVQEIFSRFKTGITRTNILMGLSRLMRDCKLLHVYTPDEMRMFIKIEDSSSWRVWHSIPAPGRELFDRAFWYGNSEAKEMLLFSERGYINTHFANYDPARQDMWAEYNRPWDFDHIVARNRIDRKQGTYREYDKAWLNCIGNLAAISYESNRSKSDTVDYNEYHDNEKNLSYNPEVESLEYELTYYASSSRRFAEITYNRFCNIYESAYNVIRSLASQIMLSQTLEERKMLFEAITQYYPNSLVHFAASDQNDYRLEREQDWARQWIGVGIIQGEFMVCCEWSASKEEPIEIGIRKALGMKVTEENMKLLIEKAKTKNLNLSEDSMTDWWYIQELSKCREIDYIKEKMDYYLSLLG